MDRKLLERMIGAVVLVGLLVIVAPALLDGGGERDAEQPGVAAEPDGADGGLRRHTMRLDQEPQRPPVAQELTGTPGNPPATLPPPVDKAARDAEPAAVTTESENEPTDPELPKPESSDPEPLVVAKSEPRPKAPAATPEPVVRPTPAKTVAVPEKGWAVQLGSFSQQDNARRLAAEVEKKGFATFLMPLEKNGRTLYRVRVGPGPDRAAAEKLAAKLAAAGYMGRPVPQNPES